MGGRGKGLTAEVKGGRLECEGLHGARKGQAKRRMEEGLCGEG